MIASVALNLVALFFLHIFASTTFEVLLTGGGLNHLGLAAISLVMIFYAKAADVRLKSDRSTRGSARLGSALRSPLCFVLGHRTSVALSPTQHVDSSSHEICTRCDVRVTDEHQRSSAS